MTEVELVWLAGLLEGEGTFRLEKGRPGQFQPCIEVAMCDEDVIERVAALFGKTICFLRSRKPTARGQYRTRIRGRGAAELMKQLYPYMGERRRNQIDYVLSTQ